MKDRAGRSLLRASVLLGTVGVPLVVFPGLAVIPGDLLWHWMPRPLVFGMADATDVPKWLLMRLAAACALAGVALLGPRRLTRQGRVLALLGGIYLLLALLAAVASGNPAWSMPGWLNTLAGAVLVGAWVTGLEEVDLRFGTICLLTAAGLAAAYSLLQHTGHDFLSWSHPEMAYGRTISTMGNPDFLAHYLATTLPLVQSWPLLALVVASLCITQTRAAAVALLVAAGVAAGKRPWPLLIAAAVVALFILLLRPIDPHQRDAAARVYLWKVAAQVTASRPWLGVGQDMFPFAALAHRDMEPMAIRNRMALAEDPHNVFLSTAVTAGVPALLVLLAMLGLVLAVARRTLTTGELAGLVAFWVEAQFIYPTPPSIIACLWLATLALWRGVTEAPRLDLGRVPAICAAVVLLVATVHVAVISTAEFELKAASELTSAMGQGNSLDELGGEAKLRYEAGAARSRGWRSITVGAWTDEAHMLAAWFHVGRSPRVARDALDAYQRAIEGNPGNPYPRMDRAQLLTELGSVLGEPFADAALQDARVALQLDPYNPIFWSAFGRSLLALGHPKPALDAFSRSVALYPDSAPAHAGRARALLADGQREAARREAQKVLLLDHDNREAREIIERITRDGG
ncbi:MAG: O-antigen ligase family protein [Candidatus Xenobia bacterium]